MNIVAFVLAVLAVVAFVAAFYGVRRKWASHTLGLAFLAAAWIAQLTIQTIHVVTVNWP